MNNKWKEIKKDIYFVDGSLRNIYINNTTEKYWGKWINYVNENYKINWNNENKINFEIIKNNWKENIQPERASIFIENIQINCHFFIDFGNGFDPKEIKNIHDHNCIIKYMKDISKILDVVIYLSDENVKDNYLIKIYRDEIYGI